MDQEMREYLEGIRKEILGRVGQVEERLNVEVGGLNVEVGGLKVEVGDLKAGQERLEARIDAQGQMLMDGMAAMEQRVIENIRSRREDIDAAFGDINILKRRVRSLEDRVEVLEGRDR